MWLFWNDEITGQVLISVETSMPINLERDPSFSLCETVGQLLPHICLLPGLVQSHQISSLAQDAPPRFRTWSLHSHIRSLITHTQTTIRRPKNNPFFSAFIGLARDVSLPRRVLRKPLERPRSGEGLQEGRGAGSRARGVAARLLAGRSRVRRERVGGGQPCHSRFGKMHARRGIERAVIDWSEQIAGFRAERGVGPVASAIPFTSFPAPCKVRRLLPSGYGPPVSYP